MRGYPINGTTMVGFEFNVWADGTYHAQVLEQFADNRERTVNLDALPSDVVAILAATRFPIDLGAPGGEYHFCVL